MAYKWMRRFPDSNSNFDLVLQNPKDFASARMNHLLESIEKQTHRGQTLSDRAIAEFRRFFDHPETPLKSDAYVLLSNWFMTGSGDRNSVVANRCEDLWDELFPCRPSERLSSPAAGKNHIMVVPEFQSFWSRVSKAQGDGTSGTQTGSDPSFSTENVPDAVHDPASGKILEGTGSLRADNHVRATFVKEGLQFQVEGTPRAMAAFLKSID